MFLLVAATAIFAQKSDYGAVSVSGSGNGNRMATIYGDTTVDLNVPSSATVARVEYHSARFAAGKLFTITLPFNLKNAGKVKLSGGKFYEFVDIAKESGTWTVSAKGESVENLVAHVPYIFIPDSDDGFSIECGNGNNKIELESTLEGAKSVDLGHNWTMRGTYTYKKWEDGDPEIGHVYGFAAKEKDVVQHDGTTKHVTQGEFVRAAAGAFIKPMRAYLYYNKASSGSAGRPAANGAHGVQYRENRPDASPWSAANGAHNESIASIDDNNLPETIGLKLLDENGKTTAIGRMDSKTGEMRIDKWYDLKGRKLGPKPEFSGICVNKGVVKALK